MSVTIRRATPADADALAQLAAQTFSDAFGADNRPEDLALHLETSYGPQQQGREIADASIVTLLAHVGPRLAGYTQLRRGPAPRGVLSAAAIEVWRFYVAQDWHGRGVAQSLMQRVDDEARMLGADTVWLGVWERNPRGIAFYTKSGFVDVGSHVFVVGTDEQTDRIMARAVPPVRAHAT